MNTFSDSSSRDLDQVTLVDKHDNVLGAMDKLEAHRGEGVLHRASSVFLFRKKAGNIELLIQQRSDQKIVGAGQWANTVCGNVRPTENYLECAKRRLREELGITDLEIHLEPMKKFIYQAACNEEYSENEFVQVFAGSYGGEIILNPEEVQNAEWQIWNESDPLEIVTKKQVDEWAPWFPILIKNSFQDNS